jgi:hypothetical protein
MARRHAIAAALLLLGCSGKKLASSERFGAVTFPALPKTEAEAAALVAAETRRPPPATVTDVDADAIAAALDTRAAGPPVAGDAAVSRAIQAVLDRGIGDAYVLFGTYHDAPGQIDAFRRLVGPGGLRGLTLAAAEQFRADGEWQGAPFDAQRGDGALLEAWTVHGDRAALQKLAEQHRDGDYAAWKLGYEATVLDLAVTARAAGLRFAGCDMPARLQELSGAQGALRNRLREIHCVRSLPPAFPRRTALLWGMAHVRPDGLVRFLPPGAAVLAVHVFGQRQGAGAVETALGKIVAINDPVLVPLGPESAALLLPDETLGGHVDRVLTSGDGPGPTSVTVRAEAPGTITLGDRTVAVGREPVTLALAAGQHTYAYRGGGLRVVGALALREGHRVELGIDPAARLTSYFERSP